MFLQMQYPSEEEIPSACRELYSADGSGIWHLTGVRDLPDPEENARLREELEKEKELSRKNSRILRQFGNGEADPEAFLKEHETLKTELAETRDKLLRFQEQAEKSRIENSLREASRESGLRPEAVRDVLARAALFAVTPEGEVRTREGNQLPSEWLAETLKESPHWLPPSRSARARSYSSAPPRREKTTISDLINETWNLTTRR